jgi:hypothetical protein
MTYTVKAAGVINKKDLLPITLLTAMPMMKAEMEMMVKSTVP